MGLDLDGQGIGGLLYIGWSDLSDAGGWGGGFLSIYLLWTDYVSTPGFAMGSY